MSEVIRFPSAAGSVDELLDETKDVGLSEAIVAGYVDDAFYVRVSNMQVRDLATLHRQLGFIVDQCLLSPEDE